MKNAETSRERILEAATAEFAAFGIAGARVDHIAEAAGCNKNLIYMYFENKEKLFTTVLQKHLTRIYEEVHFTPDDLPGYATRVFDFAMARPDLMRLMAWFGPGTEGGPPTRAGSNYGHKAGGAEEGSESRSGWSGFSTGLSPHRHHGARHGLDGREPLWSITRSRCEEAPYCSTASYR